MVSIISFYSPKTAGSSCVSLNAAVLQKLLNPHLKVAFVEVGGWSSQAACFPTTETCTWDKLFPFYKTSEWNASLLKRACSELGAEIFWAPKAENYSRFKPSFAHAWLKLMESQYDLVVLDITASAPTEWQNFWFKQSHKVVAVLTPDPVSENAYRQWLSVFEEKEKVHYLWNQTPRSEVKKIQRVIGAKEPTFIGCLSQDASAFWSQHYQAQLVALQKKSRFKKDLLSLLPSIFNHV